MLRVNSAKTIQDRPGQPAYEMFGIIKIIRNRYFTTIGSSSVKKAADRHRLAAYHSKHCRRAFQWYQHRWPWTTL